MKFVENVPDYQDDKIAYTLYHDNKPKPISIPIPTKGFSFQEPITGESRFYTQKTEKEKSKKNAARVKDGYSSIYEFCDAFGV